VFNLGNPDEYTILQFAEQVLAACGSSSGLEYRPLLFEDDPNRRRPDITRSRAHLDWEPRIPLREGLEKTIAWYRTQI
jgi:nucleoside-diphosphate-sugar epimerase